MIKTIVYHFMMLTIIFLLINIEKMISKNGIIDKYAAKDKSNFNPYKNVLKMVKKLIS